MREKMIAIAASVALIGCAAQVQSSSERSVVVKARLHDVGEAQKLADAECKKAGRLARLSGKASLNQFVYDCVD